MLSTLCARVVGGDEDVSSFSSSLFDSINTEELNVADDDAFLISLESACNLSELFDL